MGLFKNKPYKSVKAGAFQFDFYYKEGKVDKCYLDITTPSKIFSLRIGGNTHAYGYLLAAAQQDKVQQLQGYAVSLFIPAMAMTQEQGLTDEIQRAITKWQKRKEKAAESAAKSVSDARNQADEQLVRESIKRGQMSRKEARKASEADRAEMKQILKEDKESEE
ncbi:MAG: hypothetical protein NC209_03960 [Alistipes sp.]|nr:hypothetical protein [Lachnospiraceae bacterium]MCM1250286.1 hypothetical protein [Alistipes sp.]